jgi:hypothetical protein
VRRWTAVGASAILTMLLVVPPAPAGACVCYESAGLEADYREAVAVFAGQIVALEVAEAKSGDHVNEDMVATLKVTRRWKGPKDALLRVRTCGTQTMICTCGTNFELGAHFVVFAVGAPLATGSCQRTQAYTPVPATPGLEWVGVEKLVEELDVLSGKRK